MNRIAGFSGWVSPCGWMCLFAALLLFVGRFTKAQEYRSMILGRVTDRTGAVVPKAVITAEAPASRLDSDGRQN